jgi:hypothetical protein
VWGRAADDVWLVGTGALVLHWTGDAFERVDIGMDPPRTLLTVQCSGQRCAAVGGFGTGVIFEQSPEENDGEWTEKSPGLPAMLGVCHEFQKHFLRGVLGRRVIRQQFRASLEDHRRPTTEKLF